MLELPDVAGDLQAVSERWRRNVETWETWTPTTQPGDDDGEAGGFFVTCGRIDGYCKPSVVDIETPRAAHEKIAADIAFELGLPVPPVLLHRWPAAPFEGCCLHTAISLQQFRSPIIWRKVAALPILQYEALVDRIAPTCARLVPFDTWLDNYDRANHGNLVVSSESLAGPLSVAYIDYSFSMVSSWRSRGGRYEPVQAAPAYPAPPSKVARHLAAMSDVVNRIEAISEDTIAEIVGRISEDFLRPDQRDAITEGLRFRQHRVRAALQNVYGDLP